MRYLFWFITLLLFTNTSANASVRNPDNLDSLIKSKIKEYTKKIRKADVYEAKTEQTLLKVTNYNLESRNFLDSALAISKKAESDKKNIEQYITLFNHYYFLSSSLSQKADSLYKKALLLRDSTNRYYKEAEAYYFEVAEEYLKLQEAENEEETPVYYVIQVCAGKIEKEEMEKVKSEVSIITPSDGIRRYIVGSFTSERKAIEYRKKMIDLGFKDSFIRTLNSLEY